MALARITSGTKRGSFSTLLGHGFELGERLWLVEVLFGALDIALISGYS